MKLKQISENIGNHLVFKASFDKANRSSVDSFRGPGIEKGIEIFKELQKQNFILSNSLMNVVESWPKEPHAMFGILI